MKALLRSRFTWLSALAIVGLCAVVALAALIDEDTKLEDLYNYNLHNALVAQQATGLQDLADHFLDDQYLYLYITPPDPDFILFQPGGMIPILDLKAFPDSFIDGLAGTIGPDGIRRFPVWIYEDADSPGREIVVETVLGGKQVARISREWGYSPDWFARYRHPELDAYDPWYRDWLLACYDPSRICMRYDLLVGEDDLIKLVWKQSIDAALAAKEKEELGGGMMKSSWSGSVTNLQFVEIYKTNDCMAVVLAYPEEYQTNSATAFEIFTCDGGSGLIDFWWELGTVTNVDTSTNYVEWIDTESSNSYVDIRFYVAAVSNDVDGDGITDGFEKYVSHTSVTNSNSYPVVISGTLSYSGPQDGFLWMVAATESNAWSGWPVRLSSPGSYSNNKVPVGSNYWFKAYRDSNANGEREAWEAQGVYTTSSVSVTADISNVNITLADPDDDADSLSDWWEMQYFGDLDEIASGDPDGDALANSNEFAEATDPTDADSDDDGISDADEIAAGTDPNSADSDGDGLTDYEEIYTYFGHVDPMDADTDDDGLNDYAELVTHGTSPRNSDTDQDDLSDYAEVNTYSTSPLLVDTDGDGIDDKYEVDKSWDPNDSGTATDDDDGDGFNNLTEYQWLYQPTSSNSTPPTSQRIIVCPHGSNSVQHTDSRLLAVGDQGDHTSRFRVRPYYQNGALADQRLYHTQTPGFYINGTAASSMSSPITVAASSSATEYVITSDATARGTNLYIRLTSTNDPGNTKDSVRCYFPEVEETTFWGPGSANYVDVDYGETNTLWIAMPANTNDCRLRMDPDQEPNNWYGIGYFHWTDWVLAKVTGTGADPSSATLNALDWQSAYGVWNNDIISRGIKLDTGTYTVEVGYDMDASGALESSEVQETCYVNVIEVDADVDTDNDGDIDEDNSGEDVFEEHEPGVIVCETLHGDDTNTDHLVELKISFLPASLTTGTVHIAASSGGSNIKLWSDTNSSSEVTLPTSWNLGVTNPPTSLWIDGVDTGEAVIDLYFKNPDNDEVMRDKVAVYVTRTPSWGPLDAQGYAYSWQPCAWSGDGIGQGSNTHNTVVDNIVSQGWDIAEKRFIDDSTDDDDFGDCTLANFKNMRYAPIAAISTHGCGTSLHAVYASSSNAITTWIDGESGMWVDEWEEDDMFSAEVSSSWIAQNWNVMGFDYRRAITMFMTCNGATGGTNSLVARAGGRAAFGYATTPSHSTMQSNNNRLFGRMNGTRDSATLRPAIEAYAEGDGYGASLTMFGNGWSTLCPAPIATYPDDDPGQRKGWGCIIFDTYMDDTISASEALTQVAGGAAVSNIRWLGNDNGSFALGFDFDNSAGGGLTLRANADKCLHSGSGWGRELDGNGVQPNGDDPPDWP